MIFNTPWFLIFITIFFLIFYGSPTPYVRLVVLLIANIIFHYHFAGPAGILPVVIVGVVTFLFGIALEDNKSNKRKQKLLFILSLAVPTFALIFYKYNILLLEYFNFSQSNLGFEIAIPLAISFFTFEYIHYLCEVYKGMTPSRNIFQFAQFIIFFPSLVAGPIKRFDNFIPQIENGIPAPRKDDIVKGLLQIIIGYAKKLIVADNATILVRLIENHPNLESKDILLLMILLFIRILFDFSGYSDIAIGLSRMIGITLPINFNYPYISRNISEFWRRWHISLSSWIRDYLYIPLGGNRLGMAKKAVVLILVMFICGMWHGAAWHFGIWGIYHGIGLGINAVWKEFSIAKKLKENLLYICFCFCLTNLFVMYGWLLFFYPLDKVYKYTLILFYL